MATKAKTETLTAESLLKERQATQSAADAKEQAEFALYCELVKKHHRGDATTNEVEALTVLAKERGYNLQADLEALATVEAYHQNYPMGDVAFRQSIRDEQAPLIEETKTFNARKLKELEELNKRKRQVEVKSRTHAAHRDRVRAILSSHSHIINADEVNL